MQNGECSSYLWVWRNVFKVDVVSRLDSWLVYGLVDCLVFLKIFLG